MPQKRLPLIINTHANGARGSAINSWLARHLHYFCVYGTRDLHEARDLAAKLAHSGNSKLVVAGGDGTINHVIQGLIGSECELGILPSGTMNVFARELGIPLRNFSSAWDIINEGVVKPVDIFEVNGHPFMQMAGVGFDAEVINATSWEAKKLLGPLAYVITALRTLGKKATPLQIEFDDGSIEQGDFVLIGNGSRYGGKHRIFPDAHNGDGKLDVLVVRQGVNDIVGLLTGSYLNFTLLGSKLSKMVRQTSSLKITADKPVPFELDGDVFGTTPVEVKALSGKLKVCVPHAKTCSKEPDLSKLFEV